MACHATKISCLDRNIRVYAGSSTPLTKLTRGTLERSVARALASRTVTITDSRALGPLIVHCIT